MVQMDLGDEQKVDALGGERKRSNGGLLGGERWLYIYWDGTWMMGVTLEQRETGRYVRLKIGCPN